MENLNIAHIALAVLLTALGQTGHLGLVKIPSMQEKAAAVNMKWSFSEWWGYDWTRIVAIFCMSIGIEIVIELLNGVSPKVDLMKFGFYLAWGFMISSIVQKKYSTYEKYVMRFIDLKANIADSVTDKVANSNSGTAVITQEQIDEIKPSKDA